MMKPSDRAKALLVHPQVSAFLDALDECFPERTPDPCTPIDKVNAAAGERALIRRMLSWREEAHRRAPEASVFNVQQA